MLVEGLDLRYRLVYVIDEVWKLRRAIVYRQICKISNIWRHWDRSIWRRERGKSLRQWPSYLLLTYSTKEFWKALFCLVILNWHLRFFRVSFKDEYNFSYWKFWHFETKLLQYAFKTIQWNLSTIVICYYDLLKTTLYLNKLIFNTASFLCLFFLGTHSSCKIYSNVICSYYRKS